MLINSVSSKENTINFVNTYIKLLEKGADVSKVLVLLLNSGARNEFKKLVLEKIGDVCIENLKIHSFNSLVYNTISDNWGYLETAFENKNLKFFPNLVGLEISQTILKNIMKEIEVKGYNSKKSLLHQLFRRYSLIVQNNLSPDDIDKRVEILKESFSDDAKKIISEFLAKTYEYKSYDYIRQILVFNYIYKHTDYFKNIEYLIVQDADEMTPVVFDFIEYISGNLKDYFIQFDEKGSSRCGYLSAETSVKNILEKIFSEKSVDKNEIINPDAALIYGNAKGDLNNELKNFSLMSPSKRPQMVEMALNKINLLIAQGVTPCDIAVITPNIDNMLKFYFNEKLQNACPFYLTGSEKLADNPLVRSVLNILKLSEQTVLKEHDYRNILTDFFKIPLKFCQKFIENYLISQKILLTDNDSLYFENYHRFYLLMTALTCEKLSLSEKLCLISKELPKDISKKDLIKFDFLVKQINDYEKTFSDYNNSLFDNLKIINQIENSIISENPSSDLVINSDDLVISTPQKFIDNKINTQYQFWLDVSSADWIKNDTGPLYNAWVFQKNWTKEEFTVDDEVSLTKEKNARVLRKLVLLNSDKIYAYSSLFDSLGCENTGGIEKYIKTTVQDKCDTDNLPLKPFTPRDDQKEILQYKKGKLAVSAVPGAGKTTVLLELVLKLLNDGINPENIFILTYMESAARNFRDRIKNRRTNDSKLPNISTIHGLALKIIKENGNYERLGLPSDFEICDDSARMRIIKTVSKKLHKGLKQEEFERGISVLKLSNFEIPDRSLSPKMANFVELYNEYQKNLKESGLIDYDDILLAAVKLLENNKDIRDYYANICEYIIEDEAQDSSSIQQHLIELLTSKHGNLIRCGDLNQAITATFTNSDIQGFKNFIKNSKNITMNRSQRCAKEIYEFANKIVADGNVLLPDTFFDIKMKEVEGRNPKSFNAVYTGRMTNEFAEKNFILKNIRKIFEKDEKATVAILLRDNYSVGKWAEFISNAGLKCITRSECLAQKAAFKLIFALIDFLNTPFDNEKVEKLYLTFVEIGLAPQNLTSELKNLAKPFLTCDVDDLINPDLKKFYWEIEYWANFSSLPPEEIALKTAEMYFKSDIEKMNIFLIATLIKRIYTQNPDINALINSLSALAALNNLSGYKFFTENDEEKGNMSGKIQIMTMHKSKGDEFDYVFIPNVKGKLFEIPEDKNAKKVSNFSEEIKSLNPKYRIKSPKEIKEMLVSENLRLIYVAVTRARKKLFITTTENDTANFVLSRLFSL
ncbi:ATP-dependent helicase [bacterium]|nr:ATP-dependent helicase [bacterium]